MKVLFTDTLFQSTTTRTFHSKDKANDLMERLYGFLESWVDVARVKHGNRQTLETLINEEALLLVKYLRNERETWSPRIAIPN